jgi:hypothetical protein
MSSSTINLERHSYSIVWLSSLIIPSEKMLNTPSIVSFARENTTIFFYSSDRNIYLPYRLQSL